MLPDLLTELFLEYNVDAEVEATAKEMKITLIGSQGNTIAVGVGFDEERALEDLLGNIEGRHKCSGQSQFL